MCVSRGLDNVTGYACGHDLGHDVFVGEPDDETVLWCVVLVFVLVNETDSCSVIGLTSCIYKEEAFQNHNREYQQQEADEEESITSSSPELDLVPLEVSIRLGWLHKHLTNINRSISLVYH